MTKRFKKLDEKRRAIARSLWELEMLFKRKGASRARTGAKAGIGGTPLPTRKGGEDGR